MINKEELYKKALDNWGIEEQLYKLEEELIEALFALRMYRENKGLKTDLIEELVDVEIMTDQVKFFNSENNFNQETWENIKQLKLQKLQKYLTNE